MIDKIIQSVMQNPVIYIVILAWLIYSIYLISKLYKSKDINSINLYVYSAIPTVFASLGVLGTFIGIYYGLQEFDTSNIGGSVGRLLEGLKTAFITSIIGISLSVLCGRISEWVLDKINKEASQSNDSEISALNQIVGILSETKRETNENFKQLQRSLTGDNSDSVSMQLVKINNKFTEFQATLAIKINEIVSALGGDNETSLLSQIQKMRSEQNSALSNAVNILTGSREDVKLQTAALNEVVVALGSDSKTNLLSQIQMMQLGQEEFAAHASENLNNIRSLLTLSNDDSKLQSAALGEIISALGGDNETSLLSQIQKMRSEQNAFSAVTLQNVELVVASMKDNREYTVEKFKEFVDLLAKSNTEKTAQTAKMNEIISALGGDNETSLLSQIQKMRSEQNAFSAATQQNVEFIVASMKENREYIAEKFKEFADLLAKSNTEKLVEAMKAATEQFNAQMKELIDKLIKENFDELNKSVERMNEWQQENKEMIKTLTEQFITVAKDLALSAQSIKEITQNTEKLTNDNSMLKRLIEELQKVMIDDKKFGAITAQLEKAVSNTEETTAKLQEWIRDEKHFSESVEKLLKKLEDVEKIKDINDSFWQNLKKQLEDGVGIIAAANKSISEGIKDNLERLDNSFESRLMTTFENLDKLLAQALQYRAEAMQRRSDKSNEA
jgi:hypothetical protein